jgi:hypothetical protein
MSRETNKAGLRIDDGNQVPESTPSGAPHRGGSGRSAGGLPQTLRRNTLRETGMLERVRSLMRQRSSRLAAADPRQADDLRPAPPGASRPVRLSFIVIFHDMAREAPRTLFSLSRAFQHGIEDLQLEVIAIDHGSPRPLEHALVDAQGPGFVLTRIDTDAVSPVAAINAAIDTARGDVVAVHIDGARILSPGVLAGMAEGFRLHRHAFVHTLGFHLGPGPQAQTMLCGYDQATEDRLLEETDWRRDGYRLFDISALAVSSAGGYFSDLQESNCIALRRSDWLELGGFHPGFVSPGGGLCNLDLYNRAMQHPDLVPIRLLGEGSFHQIHGGVATNARPEQSPWEAFQAEYQGIRGSRWELLRGQDPIHLGRLHPRARRFAPIVL